MINNYKAVAYTVITHHEEKKGTEPWDWEPEYDTVETRYRIESTETGEVLDDAQGYGYRTAQNAYASFEYKNRDKSKDKARRKLKKHIRTWMKEHEEFVDAMDYWWFRIAKGSMGPDVKFNAELVRKMLKDEGLNPDFTAGDLLKVWKSSKE